MKNFYTLIFCLLFISLQAQEYYYNGSERVNVNKSENSFISFDSPTKMKTLEHDFRNVKTFRSKGFTILKEKKNSFSKMKLQENGLSQTTPALLLENDENYVLFPTKTIRIKLKSNSKNSELAKKLKKMEL